MKQKHYEHEFKVQTVKLALEIAQTKASRELNLPENTIYSWMHAYRMGKLDLGSEMQTPAGALRGRSPASGVAAYLLANSGVGGLAPSSIKIMIHRFLNI